jgi:hypothetical protein
MKAHVMNRREFHFVVISRRSCERAGMRYHVRADTPFMLGCARIFIYTYICTYIYYIYMYVHIYICVHTHTYIHIYIYVCAHAVSALVYSFVSRRSPSSLRLCIASTRTRQSRGRPKYITRQVRGVDARGNAANFVETEQIVEAAPAHLRA